MRLRGERGQFVYVTQCLVSPLSSGVKGVSWEILVGASRTLTYTGTHMYNPRINTV